MCTLQKVQGLNLQEAVTSFDLERLRIFQPGQVYVTLSRLTNIQSLFLSASFKQDAIRPSESVAEEYDRLHNEAFF